MKKRTGMKQGRANVSWLTAYLECLFDARPVHVLEQHKKQLELMLW